MLQSINLNQPENGFQGLITRIDGDEKLKKKLMSLGIRKGQQISILHQRHNGVVIMSNGSRVALGASIAEKVFLHMLDIENSEIADLEISNPETGNSAIGNAEFKS